MMRLQEYRKSRISGLALLVILTFVTGGVIGHMFSRSKGGSDSPDPRQLRGSDRIEPKFRLTALPPKRSAPPVDVRQSLESLIGLSPNIALPIDLVEDLGLRAFDGTGEFEKPLRISKDLERIFEISGEEKSALEQSIDRAITEIRDIDRDRFKLVFDGDDVKEYEVEDYPVEGRLVRKKLVTEVNKILGDDRHPYFLPLIEKKLEYLTSGFGGETRRFFVRFNENGTIELERTQGASVIKQTFRGQAPPAPQDSHLFLFPYSK